MAAGNRHLEPSRSSRNWLTSKTQLSLPRNQGGRCCPAQNIRTEATRNGRESSSLASPVFLFGRRITVVLRIEVDYRLHGLLEIAIVRGHALVLCVVAGNIACESGACATQITRNGGRSLYRFPENSVGIIEITCRDQRRDTCRIDPARRTGQPHFVIDLPNL